MTVRVRVLLSAAVLSAAIPAAGSAAEQRAPLEVPDVVGAGLERYLAEGADAAVRTWVAGGPLQSDEFVDLQASGLHRIESFYGPFEGSDVIRVNEITPRLKAVYLALYFKKGSAFCYLLCYRSAAGVWLVCDLDGSNTPRRILPEYGSAAPPLVTPAPASAS